MNNDNRTNNSIKNSITSLFSNVTAILVGFIAQAFFIRILNAEYLGLNGLFTNILTMLSFFELGIGNAIVYYMYKPLAEKDNERIKSLMHFYKKSYITISLIIFLIGMAILPFIDFFVNDITIDVNLKVIYFLFLVSTVISYLMVYKRNMIYADQKNYIINIIHCGYLVLLNIAQLVILYLTKNYYLYLIIKIVCQLIENIIITVIANKMYGFLKDNKVTALDKTTEKNIFKKVKALVFHKMGYIIINGTDNIIISKFFGIVVVGLYSNYYLIVNSVYTMFSQTITALTSSIGNLLVSEPDKAFETFKKVRFINFVISCFTAITILLLLQPFITIWVGKEYLLSYSVLIVIVINFFQKMQRCCYMTFKDSAGIWEEDRFIPIIESLLNIIFSIICLKIFGLAGVFIGTIISGLALWCYSYPKFVYKNLFKRKYSNYIKETLGYIFLFLIVLLITISISGIITITSNILIQLFTGLILSIIINFAVILLVFNKSENLKYFQNLLKRIISHKIKTRG